MVKTRFVCVSDSHGYSPGEGAFKLPRGDVLIHAGDLTNRGTLAELYKTVSWIENAEFEAKIVVAGNHDMTLDSAFYARHGRPGVELSEQCRTLLRNNPSITYLEHEPATVRLMAPTGPRTVFTVFGSPYSPSYSVSAQDWAFGYMPDQASALWAQIPDNASLVVAHTPPAGHRDLDLVEDPVGDESSNIHPYRHNCGCPELLRELSRVRPQLVVCGHVHTARGYTRIHWEYGNSVDRTADLPPHGSRKQHLVDLTGRGCSAALSNDCLLSPDNRRETCVVNAAVMATRWPHRGGRRFNPPVVVDLDLPEVK